jgi:lisH domain-containing protein FOPNL
MRAEIYRTLDDETLERPPVTGQQLIINEMIREYFEFIGYKHALSVFMQGTNPSNFILP